MRPADKQILYLLLSFLTMVSGYLYLRYAYKVTDELPFAQEIVLIILGTLITVLITALLLNKQTAVEIEKEQGIKFLDLKAATYERLLDLIEQMSQCETFSEHQLTDLKFMTHRLAIVASPVVLNEYQSFLQVVKAISGDMSFADDQHPLHSALSNLTTKIREDLIGGVAPGGRYTVSQVDAMIRRNSEISNTLGRVRLRRREKGEGSGRADSSGKDS
ncbi:hypothetical protein AAIA72_03735 [Hahella sp. SMD15-11]|uniref:DUF4760 domain-containing protein n=1 Tax=Thermohahella caldifontis TaxID=3142973 RepID=A0AB39UXS0_9GAMM